MWGLFGIVPVGLGNERGEAGLEITLPLHAATNSVFPVAVVGHLWMSSRDWHVPASPDVAPILSLQPVESNCFQIRGPVFPSEEIDASNSRKIVLGHLGHGNFVVLARPKSRHQNVTKSVRNRRISLGTKGTLEDSNVFVSDCLTTRCRCKHKLAKVL
jgi:hypothetical protein